MYSRRFWTILFKAIFIEVSWNLDVWQSEVAFGGQSKQKAETNIICFSLKSDFGHQNLILSAKCFASQSVFYKIHLCENSSNQRECKRYRVVARNMSLSRCACLGQLFLTSFSKNLSVERMWRWEESDYRGYYVWRKMNWSKKFRI
jgi:hypothetical protein